MTEREKLEAFIARAGFRHGWKDLESWARRMAERAVEEQDALAARLAEVEKLLRNIEKGLEGTILELRSSRT